MLENSSISDMKPEKGSNLKRILHMENAAETAKKNGAVRHHNR
jgi:hypothetical protein